MKTEATCSNCGKELRIKRSRMSPCGLTEIILEIEPCTTCCLRPGEVDYVERMAEFHKIFDVLISKHPTLLCNSDFIRRLTLITSEVGELGDAVRQKNLVEIADALGDLLYVTFGMAVEMGLNIDRIFTEIHLSNMSKAEEDGTVIKDAGGKVLKSKRYKPVDLSWVK